MAALSRSAAAAGADDDASAKERAAIRELLKGAEPLTWLFTGDSITHGALHTLGWRSYPEHFAERVRWELQRMRDVVINTGISGNRVGSILDDFDWRVARFQPHVVSIMIGMNDCSDGPSGRDGFRQGLTALVMAVRKGNALVLLNTPNTIVVEASPGRSDLPAYAQIVRDVAAAEGTALVDHYADWERAKPADSDRLVWLEDKSIHPGVYGHRAFAHSIFRELGIFDEAGPTCGLALGDC